MSSRNEPLERWQRRTLAVLREHLCPTRAPGRSGTSRSAYRIPVLSPRDRRAFLRAQWSPFLPEALWEGDAPKREGSAHVYLDVSGSMNAEMPLVIALLARRVALDPAAVLGVLRRGRAGGDRARPAQGADDRRHSMRCVLEHVARTRPAAAIVLTDGYIETLDRRAVRAALAGTRLHRARHPRRQPGAAEARRHSLHPTRQGARMIRVSEFVLPGHPDKFCDAVADAIIGEVLKVDADGYGQVEMAVWSDQVFLTGGVCTRRPIPVDFADIVVATGIAIGYTAGNHIDARKYRVTDTVCRVIDDPTQWTAKVNDQAICIGWAGYDAKVDWLPIEHWLAREFRDCAVRVVPVGRLKGQGPDGKLIVRVREEGDDSGSWSMCWSRCSSGRRRRSSTCARRSRGRWRRPIGGSGGRIARWCAPWEDVELMLNPNGPLLNGGSDGDNGQTGRKLVMDYYGPRVPIGGGALYGKDPTHIDRVGARRAREMAFDAVKQGAGECLVRAVYAPNLAEPLDVQVEARRGDARVNAQRLRLPQSSPRAPLR